MGTATAFWNWMAERYARQPIADEASYRKKVEITARYLEPGMEAVEFGCGTGSTAVLHAPRVARYRGIDVSKEMVRIAREKADEAGCENLAFSVGTLEGAALPDASVDAVLGLNILHLVPDLDATLAEIARITRPGGVFVSSTICAADFRGGLRLLTAVMRPLPFLPSVRSFSVAELAKGIEDAGFTIEERFEQRPGVVFFVARRRAD